MRINRRSPLLTYALIAANLIMFAVEFFAGALSSTEALIAVGAQQVFLVTTGEWWRLLSATFLHGGVEHILFNMMALYIWGRYAEAMLGRVRYVMVYFAAGIAGSVLSYAMSVSVSVGASGAIFGLFGSFLFLRVYHREIFDRVFGTQVIILIAVNLITGFFRPNIDLWGHFGGLAGGFLAAAVVGLMDIKVPTKIRVLAAVAYLLVFGGVLFYGYQKYMAIMLSYL